MPISHTVGPFLGGLYMSGPNWIIHPIYTGSKYVSENNLSPNNFM